MVRKWSDADTHKKTALQYSYTSIKIITMYFLKKSGFTLIEMIIVLSVIGILVTAFAPQVTQYLEKSKVTQYQSFA
jgi:prepilin-type N-terminal cleavage/methylation domain-containing protein